MLLVSEFGVVEDAAPVELGVEDGGEVLDADELVSEDGGVVELALDEVDGGVLGDIDELDDVEPDGVDGVVDDDEDVDGDGVTTGGVVVDVVDDSRLQPATPSTKPVQSSVINARFIEISKSVMKGLPPPI